MASKRASKQVTIALPQSEGEAQEFVRRFPGLVTEVANRLGKRTGSVSLVLRRKRASKVISQEIVAVAMEREQAASVAGKH